MPKRRTAAEHEARLLESARQALAIARGKRRPAREYALDYTARNSTAAPPPDFDARRIVRLRERTKLSQPVFARALNVSPATVRAWERGARAPDGAALRLLQVAEQHPEWVLQNVTAKGES